MGPAAELAQADALPRAQAQAAVADGNHKRTAENRLFDVAGHVVGTFFLVPVGKILRRHDIQQAIQIDKHVRIGIFVDRKRSRCVHYENMQQAYFNPA
jgi:hypothetical protein